MLQVEPEGSSVYGEGVTGLVLELYTLRMALVLLSDLERPEVRVVCRSFSCLIRLTHVIKYLVH